MNWNCFFKNQSSLRRKVFSGGFAAIFCASAFGSCAKAMMDPNPKPLSNICKNKVENECTTQEGYFKTLDEIPTEGRENTRAIVYTDPNGDEKIVECRLRKGKIEFKIFEEDLFRDTWLFFRDYDVEKDNDVVGFIRDNWSLIDKLSYYISKCESCEMSLEKQGKFLDLSELISFANTAEKYRYESLDFQDIVFMYINNCTKNKDIEGKRKFLSGLKEDLEEMFKEKD